MGVVGDVYKSRASVSSRYARIPTPHQSDTHLRRLVALVLDKPQAQLAPDGVEPLARQRQAQLPGRAAVKRGLRGGAVRRRRGGRGSGESCWGRDGLREEEAVGGESEEGEAAQERSCGHCC